jgi:hypothetical protein
MSGLSLGCAFELRCVMSGHSVRGRCMRVYVCGCSRSEGILALIILYELPWTVYIFCQLMLHRWLDWRIERRNNSEKVHEGVKLHR